MAMKVRKPTVTFKNYVAHRIITKQLSGKNVLRWCPDITKKELQRWCESYRLYAGVLSLI